MERCINVSTYRVLLDEDGSRPSHRSLLHASSSRLNLATGHDRICDQRLMPGRTVAVLQAAILQLALQLLLRDRLLPDYAFEELLECTDPRVQSFDFCL